MLKKRRVRPAIIVASIVLALSGAATLTACSSDNTVQSNGQEQAQENAKKRNNYVPVNDVEGNNYNARMKLADDPATLIWCSVFPSNPSVKPFTVPIVGKLTSGNKRPYPTEVVEQYTDSGKYNPELPGSDGFYGSSGEYRYGFGPDGTYQDFYGTETYCTTTPTIIQKQVTQIAIANDKADLDLLDDKVEAALKVCRAKDKNPSTPCLAAAKLLGED